MNKIYKVIFNRTLGRHVVVSEMAKSHSGSATATTENQDFVQAAPSKRFSLKALIFALFAGGLMAAPAWAVSGFVLKDGTLVYCSNTDTNTCDVTTSAAKLSSNGSILTWNGTGGFSTPSITLSGKVLAYNPSWTSAANTGLTFNGKPITPYYGVNSTPYDGGSTPNWGNYYGQGATGAGAIAIGYNASATRGNSIAIGRNASVVAGSDIHGIAIGGAENAGEAAQAGRNTIAMGYNVRLGQAGHSFGFGTNLIMKGGQNIAISAAASYNDPTKVYGMSNTVIGVNNKLEGLSSSTGYDGAVNYNDMVKNLVYGEGNTITGTSGVNATAANYSDPRGAYKNSIMGSGNILNGDNYHNKLLASDSILNTGAHHNTLLGSKITVNQNIGGSYVLGSNVTVAANNSVYFGDSSTAYTTGILRTPNGSSPTTITGTTTAADIEKYGLTIGEQGQTTAVIGGRGYNFAGLGQVNGGVISVGKVQLIPAANGVPAHYESVGRIIQNVAPGLIGASSTDAVNGSQLYAVTRAIDLSIARVTSGESGPVVYTTESGERLYKEGSTFYKTTVTTVTDTSTNTTTTYQQATNGFWYPTTSFTNGILKAGVGISEGKTLAQLAEGRTGEVEIAASNLVLSAVNAQKDSSSNTADQAAATTTLTTLKNIKNALTVLTTTALATEAKNLYILATPGANDTTWGNLTDTEKQPWREKATINNAKAKLTELLEKTNTSEADVQRALSQAVTLQDLQTLAQAGLDFAGDSGTAVHRNLSQTLTVKGGETAAANLTTLADKNIGVVADGTGSLNVLLAKNLGLS